MLNMNWKTIINKSKTYYRKLTFNQNIKMIRNEKICSLLLHIFAGFAFIQFDKTSEAAAAMEALNGCTIGNSTRPIRVTVALS